MFLLCKESLIENFKIIRTNQKLNKFIEPEIKSGKNDDFPYDIIDYLNFIKKEVESIKKILEYPKFYIEKINNYTLEDIQDISPTLSTALENYLHNFCLFYSNIFLNEKYGVHEKLFDKIIETRDKMLMNKPITGLNPEQYLTQCEIAFIRKAKELRADIAHPLNAKINAYDIGEFGKLISESFQINEKYVKFLSSFVDEIYKRQPNLFIWRNEFLLKNTIVELPKSPETSTAKMIDQLNQDHQTLALKMKKMNKNL